MRAADFEGKKKSTFTENHLITAEMVKGTTTIITYKQPWLTSRICVNHGCIRVNHGCFMSTYHPSCLVHLVGVGYILFIERVPQKVEDI